MSTGSGWVGGGAGSGGLAEPVTLTQELTSTPGTLESGVANGGSAVAWTLDTTNSISTSGAKLFSLRNATAEKLSVDKDGLLALATGSLTSSVANGASAVGFTLNTANSFSTSGAKLLSLTNAGSEKLSISKDGYITIPAVAATNDNVLILPVTGRIYSTSGAQFGRIHFDGWKWDVYSPEGIYLNGGSLSGCNRLTSFATTTVSNYANSSGTAVAVHVNAENAYTHAGAKLLKISNASVEKAHFDYAGRLSFDATDSSGSPGAATINKPSGQVAVDSGASSVVVTNSLVSTTSVVWAVLQDDTDALTVRSVVPASGSFTINLSGTTTAARKVGFIVFNA